MAIGRGTLLEQLFVRVDAKYDGRDMKRADKDVNKLEGSVLKLNTALNAMTAAFGVAAIAALDAFTGLDRQLSTLSIKAGTTRRVFEGLYRAQSRVISEETGAPQDVILQTYQRMHSLDLQGRDADPLARATAVLHHEGVMDAREAAEASIALRNKGLADTAMEALEKTVTAARRGAGETADYVQAIKGVGGMGDLLNYTIDEMLGAFTITSATAESLPHAKTQFRGMMGSLLKPSKESQEFQEATFGMTMDELRKLDLASYLKLIRDKVDKSDYLKLVGEKESVLALADLVKSVDKLEENTKFIGDHYKGIIDRIAADSGGDWSSELSKLRMAINNLWKWLGEPLATLLTPLVRHLREAVTWLGKMNDKTGGLIAWIITLVGGMLMLRWAIIGLGKVIGLARMFGGRAGGWFGGAAGRGDKKGAAARGGGGLWRGIATGLGISQAVDVAKHPSVVSGLSRIAMGVLRHLGLAGLVVTAAAGVAAAGKRVKDANSGLDVSDERKAQIEEYNRQKAYAEAGWNNWLANINADLKWIGDQFRDFFTDEKNEGLRKSLEDRLGSKEAADKALARMNAGGTGGGYDPIADAKAFYNDPVGGFMEMLTWLNMGVGKLFDLGVFGKEGVIQAEARAQAGGANAKTNALSGLVVDQNGNIIANLLQGSTAGAMASVAPNGGSSSITYNDSSTTNVDVTGVAGEPDQIANEIAAAQRRERGRDAQMVVNEMGSLASP